MTRVLWAATVLLVFLGVFAAALRVTRPDYAASAEPMRQRALASLGRSDPPGMDRLAVGREVDARFIAHRGLTLLHVVPGALYLVFAPLQFSKRIRRRLTFHRWNGRVMIVLGLLSVLPGLWFGIVMPFGGVGEAVVIAAAGTLFAGALVRAYVAIRRKQIDVHREWMLRAFAAAIAISMVRVFAGVYDVALAPSGWTAQALFVLSLWSGWAVTLGVAEFWIRYTRPATA